LSSIAVPPLWSVLPVSKEKTIDLVLLEDRELGAFQNKIKGGHHAHGLRFALDCCRYGPNVLWNDREPDLLEQSGCVLVLV
jgi:hypothetical protein